MPQKRGEPCPAMHIERGGLRWVPGMPRHYLQCTSGCCFLGYQAVGIAESLQLCRAILLPSNSCSHTRCRPSTHRGSHDYQLPSERSSKVGHASQLIYVRKFPQFFLCTWLYSLPVSMMEGHGVLCVLCAVCCSVYLAFVEFRSIVLVCDVGGSR